MFIIVSSTQLTNCDFNQQSKTHSIYYLTVKEKLQMYCKFEPADVCTFLLYLLRLTIYQNSFQLTVSLLTIHGSALYLERQWLIVCIAVTS